MGGSGKAPPAFRFIGYPMLTLVGGVAMAAIMISTLCSAPFRLTLLIGVPFLVFLVGLYPLVKRWLRHGPIRAEVERGQGERLIRPPHRGTLPPPPAR